MNQPKFKFLDKVRNKNNGESFEIAKIVLDVDTYVYFNRSSLMVAHESELELYTEPRAKKLYAYSVNNEEIRFSETGIVTLRNGEKVRRRPEYDLNFSDKE